MAKSSKTSSNNNSAAASTKVKRPLSAYMLYVQKNRAAYVAKFPDAKFPEVGRALGVQWNAMSESDKSVYSNEAALLKKAYQDLIADGTIPKPIKTIRKAPKTPKEEKAAPVKEKKKRQKKAAAIVAAGEADE